MSSKFDYEIPTSWRLSVLILSSYMFYWKAGFLSLNCGGRGSFIDDIGIEWTPDNQFMFGKTAQTPIRNRAKPQYATLRYFPADSRKYCYTLSIIPGMRYLLRATFLYGNFDGKNVYPMFDISLGATYWSTIVISDVNTMEAREMIFLATEPTVCMCLFNATRGSPFISTLELRQFNESMYSNDFEEQFYLSVSARINFGGDSEAAVRYVSVSQTFFYVPFPTSRLFGHPLDDSI